MLRSWFKQLLNLTQRDFWDRFFPGTDRTGIGFEQPGQDSEWDTSQMSVRPDVSAGRRPGSRTLDAIAWHAEQAGGVRKKDLHPGDWILVTTRNSVYTICALGNDEYSVSGGWFDREGISPQRVRIDGCTWGGNAIKCDIVAAKGLFLGFGNSVTTTRIQEVQVIRDQDFMNTN